MVISKNKKQNIGVMISSLNNSFEFSLLSGIKEFIQERNDNLICFSGRENHFSHLFSFYSLDGIIILTGDSPKKERHEPIDGSYRIPRIQFGKEVKIDYESPFRELMAHLTGEHGFRSAGFIPASKKSSFSEEKERVFTKILNAFGISGDRAPIIPFIDFLQNQQTPPVDILIGETRGLILQVLEILSAKGDMLPGSRAVACFSDPPETESEYQLAEIYFSGFETGYNMAKSLLQWKENEDTSQELIFPASYLPGSSCGCPEVAVFVENEAKGTGKVQGPSRNSILTHSSIDLPEVARKLLTVFEEAKLKRILEEELPHFNVQSCYIAEYEKQEGKINPHYAYMYFAYENRRVLDIPSKELRFFSKEILPGGFKENQCNTYIVMSLDFEEEAFGYIIYEPADNTITALDMLTIQIANALKGINLYEKVKKLSLPVAPIEGMATGKYEKMNIPEELAEKFFRKLLTALEKEAYYLDQSLDLAGLAEKLNISRHQLSFIINKYAGLNFYDFINNYRICYVIKQFDTIKDPKINILDVAFEAGFNTKSTFNKLFKKQTGKTPSEYLKEKCS